ncbi:MAG: hypothetical protein IJO96_08195 [Oscillospiraceae bacterium]|nr:hypothetical protein [Oscillospiraceae bacterium]
MSEEKENNPHVGHRERMLAKLKQGGHEAVDDEQMLEMLLYLTIPQRDTKGMAKALLKEFGSFSRVLDAEIEALVRVEGVGPKTATMLKLVSESFKTYYKDKCDVGILMDTVDRYGTYLVCRMFGITDEVLGVICLDAKFRFLSYRQLGQGSVLGTEAGNRQLIEAVLKCGASCVVLAHNHPAALLFPSEEDVKSTYFVRELMKTVEVRLLDHVIIAENEYMSMFQWGYLD